MGHRFVSLQALTFVSALGLNGCMDKEMPPQTSRDASIARMVETHEAEEQIARREVTEFTTRMQKTFEREQRDASWAPKFESELAALYKADDTVSKGALERAECRTSRCTIDFSVSAERNLLRAQSSIFNWLSAKQPCGFYVGTQTPADPQTGSFVQRVYLDCER